MNRFKFVGEVFSEVSVLSGGVVRFRIKVISNDGKDHAETTNYFRLVAFDKLAKEIEATFKVGMKVKIDGFVRNTRYQKDGKTVYGDDFVVQEFSLGV